MQNSTKKLKKIGNSIIQSRKNVDDFWLKFEIEERCKGVHCVDLGESFPTCKNRRRYSRERAPRSLGENYSILFIRVLSSDVTGSCPDTCNAFCLHGFVDTAEDAPKRCPPPKECRGAYRSSSRWCLKVNGGGYRGQGSFWRRAGSKK